MPIHRNFLFPPIKYHDSGVYLLQPHSLLPKSPRDLSQKLTSLQAPCKTPTSANIVKFQTRY